MTDKSSFLDALRDEYETVQHVPSGHGAVEEFNVIGARMRKSYKWLEKAVTYPSSKRRDSAAASSGSTRRASAAFRSSTRSASTITSARRSWSARKCR